MTNKRLTLNAKTARAFAKKGFAFVWNNDFGYVHSIAFFVSKISLQLKQKIVLARKHAFDASVVAFVGMIVTYVFFPVMANADMTTGQKPVDHKTVALVIEAMQNETKAHGVLPQAEDAKPRKTFTVAMTAYTSDPAQTDDTPCITASGMDVCERDQEDVVAANFLPLGTRVRIPELYGDRVFTVQDRMNARYDKRMDFWMKDIKDAKKFGLKRATVEVF